jgi:hypothetical protein
MGRAEPEKYSQLRAKTDRQLFDFIRSKLDLGLSQLAEGENSSARQAVMEAETLLRAVNEHQRQVLESNLSELREALDRLEWNEPDADRHAGLSARSATSR